MAKQVAAGAQLTCIFGTAPAALIVLPLNRTSTEGQSAATINDCVPIANLVPFGLCTTPTNPMVAAATATASGVLTPVPCIPAVPLPWAPGDPTVLIGGIPALTSASQCLCMWGGTITVSTPGQMTVDDG